MVTGGTRSRLLAFAVMSAVFVAGGMAGIAMQSLLRAQETSPTPGAPRPERSERRERHSIFDDLNLSAEQQAKVDSIFDKRRRDMNAFWEEHGPDMRAIYDSTKAEIDRTLTTEQRAKLEEFRARRRRDAQHDGKDGPGAFGPKPSREKQEGAPAHGGSGEKAAPPPEATPSPDRATRDRSIPAPAPRERPLPSLDGDARPVLAAHMTTNRLKHS